MKINIKYSWVITSILVTSCYFRVEMMFILLCLGLLILAFNNQGKINFVFFPGKKKYIYFILLGLIFGFTHIISEKYKFNNIFKDFVYSLLPLLFWLIGMNCSINNKSNKYNYEKIKTNAFTSIYIGGVIYVIVDLLHATLMVMLIGLPGSSIHDLRTLIGTGSSFPVICLFLTIYLPDYLKIKKYWKNIGNILFFFDACIHFSRMNVLVAAVLLIFSGIIKSPKKILKYGIIILLALVVTYNILPNYVNIFIEKILYSVKEMFFYENSWDMTNIVHHWRGYEVYCEIKKFTEASIIEKLLGAGFGSQLDLGGYAYLVTTEEEIPFLHNGYFTILMKWGIIGIIAYIAMLFDMFRTRITNKMERNLFKAIVVIIAVDTLFVHGLFFSPAVSNLMLILAVISLTNRGNCNAAKDNIITNCKK